MLKKFLKDKTLSDNIFPLNAVVNTPDVPASGGASVVDKQQNQRRLTEHELTDLVRKLVQLPELFTVLEPMVTSQLLEKLQAKYDFAPIEQYRIDAENKKKYIEQLDEYLKERKEINHTVENDLQNFLKETTTNLSAALENFTTSIHTRVREAENRYGIDAIKNAVLNNTNV